jgi:phosphate butyryltransferase
MPITTFRALLAEAGRGGPRRVAIAAAAVPEALEAAHAAQRAGVARCVLIDAPERLAPALDAAGLPADAFEILPAPGPQDAARLAMRLARDGEADVVVKGAVPTATFLQAALDREVGVRTGRLLTHVGVYELPGLDRLLLVSDGGVVVAPDLYQKAEIVQNAIEVAHRLGIAEPKVAVLAAAEMVNPKIPATLDAAGLAKMAERGQIRGGVVDGPLALDNALSEASGRAKGIRSPVLGRADVLIAPDIEAGNLLGKAMLYLGGGEMAGVVVGGRVPLVVTSRSGSRATREVSIALGVLLAGGATT